MKNPLLVKTQPMVCVNKPHHAAASPNGHEPNPVKALSRGQLSSSTTTPDASISGACAGKLRANLKDNSMSKDDQIDDGELTKLGIERRQTEIFLWGGYRYSNARDALAAAKRGAKP